MKGKTLLTLATIIVGGIAYGKNQSNQIATAELNPVEPSWTQLVLENVPPSEKTKEVYNTIVRTEKKKTSEYKAINYEISDYIYYNYVDKYNILGQLVERQGHVIPGKEMPMEEYKYKYIINRDMNGEITSQSEFMDGHSFEKLTGKYGHVIITRYLNGEVNQISHYYDKDGDGFYESNYDGMPTQCQERHDRNKDGIPDLMDE